MQAQKSSANPDIFLAPSALNEEAFIYTGTESRGSNGWFSDDVVMVGVARHPLVQTVDTLTIITHPSRRSLALESRG